MTPTLRELLERATPGVLHLGENETVIYNDNGKDLADCYQSDLTHGPALAALFVAAVNALPSLLDKADRVEGLEKALTGACDALGEFSARARGMSEWLRENAPYCFHDQKHLDADTPERAYWHYGYLVALRDVMKRLERDLINPRGSALSQEEERG